MLAIVLRNLIPVLRTVRGGRSESTLFQLLYTKSMLANLREPHTGEVSRTTVPRRKIRRSTSALISEVPSKRPYRGSRCSRYPLAWLERHDQIHILCGEHGPDGQARHCSSTRALC